MVRHSPTPPCEKDRSSWMMLAMRVPTVWRYGRSGMPGSWTTSSHWRMAARTNCRTCRCSASHATRAKTARKAVERGTATTGGGIARGQHGTSLDT
jgi:hypothetical protein